MASAIVGGSVWQPGDGPVGCLAFGAWPGRAGVDGRPRVYWVRRLAVLGTATLLVFALGRMLVGGSDGSDSGSDDPGAVQAAATLGPSVGRPRPVRRS